MTMRDPHCELWTRRQLYYGGALRYRSVHHVCNSSVFCLGFAMITICVSRANEIQTDPAVIQMLQRQIVEAGGSMDCVELATFTGIRGVRATCDIETGRVLMFAPAHTLLSTWTTDSQVWDEIVPDDETLFLVKRGKDPATAAALLALVMLHEMSLGNRSLFAAHLASMPAEPPNILALGDELQIQAISSVLPDAGAMRDKMMKVVSDNVIKSPSMFGNASKADQRQAISYVLSRSHAYVSKHLTNHVMVPFQDLPNHDESPNCRQTCDAAGCKFVALRDIAHGEQISHSYGAKSDLTMLYAYGFVPHNNYSALRITIDASEDAVVNCGNSIKLDKVSPLAVEAKASTCFQEFDGSPKFLNGVFNACSELMGHLTHKMKIYKTLEQLSARSPAQALDAKLEEAVREESSTLQRCISESGEALGNAVLEL